MGLARIAIAVLAVVVAVGLLIIGGIALWGALTSKDGEKPNAASPSPSNASSAGTTGHSGGSGSTGKARPSKTANRVGNAIAVHCLAAQCHVFVGGPGATDVIFSDNLGRDESREWNETRLTVVVQDASTIAVTINGIPQPRGPRGPKTYQVPAPQ